MDRDLTIRDFIAFVAVLLVLAPLLFPIYKDKKEDKRIKLEKEAEKVEEEQKSSSDISLYTVDEMYQNSCFNQEYCPDGNNVYIKYGDFTFVVFKRYSNDSILGILVSDAFKGHVLNDYNCENGLCDYEHAKFNTETSGIKNVIDTFSSYLPNNKDEILNKIDYSTGYLDLNNKYFDDSYNSYVSLMNVNDYEIVGSRTYMFDIDTLLSTVKYSEVNIKDSTNHYWYANNKSRLSGLYASNGTRNIVSPLNRSNYNIRPIISIDSKTKITNGKGTLEDPYII